MRLILTLFFLIPLILSAAIATPDASPLSEEAQVELLIKAAQNNVDKLARLKNALKAFKTQEAICLNAPENSDQLFLLSQKALELKQVLNQCHIDDYFRPQFLQELNNLSKSAENPTVPAMNRDLVQ